jgi:alpha-L-fucosidase 2
VDLRVAPLAGLVVALGFLPAGELRAQPDASPSPVAAAPPEDRGSLLTYDRAASHFLEALPVGSGRLGAMVFGRIHDERIPLNENSLWDGFARDTTNPEALAHLPEVRRLLFAGKHAEATELAGKHFLGRPPRILPYQMLADLWLEGPAPTTVRQYRRQLDLDTGIATVSYQSEGRQTREIFASAPDEVIVVRLAGDRVGTVNTRVRLARWQDAKALPAAGGRLHLRGQIQRTEEGGSENKGLRFEACLQVQHEGGTVTAEGESLRATGATAITILIAGATSYRGQDPTAVCRTALDRAARKSFADLRAAHVKDHGGLARRVRLDLGPPPAGGLSVDRRLALVRGGAHDPALHALHFQMGRYLLIGSSRPGQLPANLQGLWNEQLKPQWNADYHLNINLQMNYWPAEITGLGDLHAPLFDFIHSLVPSGRRTAKVHYGARGWVAHHLSDAFGVTTPADGVQGIWPMGAAWLVQHLWEHYLFTGDRDFLARRAYPVMKEAALFMLDFLVPDPRGRLVTNPSHSPENAFFAKDGSKSKFTYGATMDLQIVHDLFVNTIAAAERLGLDSSLRTQLGAALRRLAPLQISPTTGRLQEWIEDYKEVDPGHRHVSHLFGVFPGKQITLRGTAPLAAAARRSLEHRLANGGGRTGWSRGWMANMWARFGDGDRAYESLKALLAENTSDALLDLHPPQIFQMDGNGGATAAMAEMLVQSHAGEIELLPALPKAWPKGEVTGLRARGNFGVDLRWEAGVLVSAKVQAGETAPCRLRTAAPVEVKVGGKRVPVRRPEPQVVTFQAQRGQTYEVAASKP